jgi:hypothetical protein
MTIEAITTIRRTHAEESNVNTFEGKNEVDALGLIIALCLRK